jgi:hypothetical protein
VWQKTLSLKNPTDSKDRLLSILKDHLERVQFSTGVRGIKLALFHLGAEEVEQKALITSETGHEANAIRRAIRSLRVRFGYNPLKRIMPLDPGSRIPERRSALRDFDP